MNKKYLLFLLFVIGGILSCASIVHAGFGIAPPYLKSKNPLFPGSHFEQKITLLRSASDGDLNVNIVINSPEVVDWITIDKGNTFLLPKGKSQVPMVVSVDVPKDAASGYYDGHISIQVLPADKKPGSGVAIALGARVDIELTVSDEEFIEFLIRKVEIPKFETLGKPWKWKIFSRFFYRIKVAMTIENTGNIAIAPSQVHLDVYDLTEKNLLESHDDKRINKIEPFTTNTVEASFPTKLEPGQYWSRLKIYKENEVVHKNKIIFEILPNGKLSGGTKLGKWPWIMLSGMIIAALIVLFILIKIKVWRYLFRLIYILSWPLRYVYKKFKAGFSILKIKFWKWIGKKSAKHQTKKGGDENSED